MDPTDRPRQANMPIRYMLVLQYVLLMGILLAQAFFFRGLSMKLGILEQKLQQVEKKLDQVNPKGNP